MSVLSVLRRGRERIANGYWTQGISCERINGRYFYCAIGALGGTNTETSCRALDLLSSCVPSRYRGSVIGYNDAKSRTRQQVVRLFDRAIAKAEKRPAR